MLNEAQRQALLALARRSVVAQVTSGRAAPERLDIELPPASGVFVTVKRRGELRGCLGTLQSSGSLVDDVNRCAADAASEDPRFPPVSPGELQEVSLELSVLGPLEEIDPHSEQAVVIGQHGLVVEQGRQRGLLLPQVATEWGWTTEQFLRQTCVKAGLPGDAWRAGATVYRFSAEVFGER
jgi:AmmeMemoRadiSam system protein A